MRVHFLHRHVHDTVVILEEGNLPLPRCPRCDLQVSRKALNGRHLETNQCKTGAPWSGGVALLQYDHGVVDMPVHKVHPHRRSCL